MRTIRIEAASMGIGTGTEGSTGFDGVMERVTAGETEVVGETVP
jgi:hypothetical protein